MLRGVMFLALGAMLTMMARLILNRIEANQARARVRAAPRAQPGITNLRRDPTTGVYRPD